MSILPPFAENFFTSRAKGVLLSAIFLNSLFRVKTKDTREIHPICVLFGLSREPGSLSKNILESHGISALKISKALGLPFNKTRNLKRLNITPYIKQDVPPFNNESKALIKKALSLAVKHDQPYVGTEHLLYALAITVMSNKKGGIKPLENQPSGSKFNKVQSKILTLPKANEIKKHLHGIFAQNMPVSNFPRFAKGPDNPLEFTGKNLDGEISSPSKERGNLQNKSGSPYSPAADEELHDFNAHDHKHKHPTLKQIKHKKRSASALEVFCENLTQSAEKGELDPVVARDNEITRLINILSRRTKNNPLLIGEPGVGKTAIVQGFAQKVANGEVPENLLNKQVLALNLNLLVAGAIFRGDFEARIQHVIHESTKNDVILFIDEIHTIIGAGSVPGSLDAANILKPALSSGKIQCIGATTLDEYKKYIEKERALERRFQPILVKEESEEQSIVTLSNLKKIYEDHHNIVIDSNAVKAAVELSSRYIRGRYLPDKAIDVLDEAASRLRTATPTNSDFKPLKELEKTRRSLTSKKEDAISRENYKDALTLRYKEEMISKEIDELKKRGRKSFLRPLLTVQHIQSVIESMTGIPVEKRSNEGAALKELEAKLKTEIIGQDRAISEIIHTIKRNKVGLNDPKRPAGSFMFIGPSGVGKTALAKAIAAAQSQNLVKLDMSEYAEPYSISRLIGAPPGYIGYEEGGELTEKIKRNPYSIVLFDEIEKAHTQIHNMLISILDDGTIQDAKGDEVSFKNATIILTSNANLDEYFDTKKSIGFSVNLRGNSRSNQERYNEYVRRILKKEILNRVDKIITFKDLKISDVEKIAKLLLDKLKENLLKNKIEVSFSKNLAGFIAKKSYKSGEGARLLRSALEKYVENPIAEHIISNRGSKKITVSLDGGKINVK